MFIANAPLFLVRKLRRSGITNIRVRQTGADLTSHQRTCRSYGAWVYFRAQRTINMALLTELFRAGCLGRRVRITA